MLPFIGKLKFHCISKCYYVRFYFQHQVLITKIVSEE